jgi:transposase
MDSSHLNGIVMCQTEEGQQSIDERSLVMKIKRIGIDLAKKVFQVHAVNEQEEVVIRKSLNRSQLKKLLHNIEPTTIAMEACGTAHYWAREMMALGHNAKLIPPQFVKPYVKRHKNDSVDAEAICEAASRPNMRYVTVKTVDQQVMQSIHRVRSRIVRSRTALINEIRGVLAEFGIVIDALGVSAVRRKIPELLEDGDNQLPFAFRELLSELYEELLSIDERLESMTKKIVQHGVVDERVKRLQELPGVGPITASAIVSSIGDAKQFKKSRDFSAWLGMVPNQHSSGGKDCLGSISKRGDSYLRTLLIHGARSCMKVIERQTGRNSDWLKNLMGRRNKNIATVALANKHARIIWAMLTRNEHYCAGTM